MTTRQARPIGLFLLAISLASCAPMSTNDAIVPLQTETAHIVGLASSDELTVSNVHASPPNALGGQDLSYTATTVRGRVFQCLAHMIPGMLTTPAKVTAPSCRPVLVHS